MENLSPEDQATFTNKNNIVVMLALPDSEDAGTDEGNITSGKSVMLNFDKTVDKYSLLVIIKAFYFVNVVLATSINTLLVLVLHAGNAFAMP